MSESFFFFFFLERCSHTLHQDFSQQERLTVPYAIPKLTISSYESDVELDKTESLSLGKSYFHFFLLLLLLLLLLSKYDIHKIIISHIKKILPEMKI